MINRCRAVNTTEPGHSAVLEINHRLLPKRKQLNTNSQDASSHLNATAPPGNITRDTAVNHS